MNNMEQNSNFSNFEVLSLYDKATVRENVNNYIKGRRYDERLMEVVKKHSAINLDWYKNDRQYAYDELNHFILNAWGISMWGVDDVLKIDERLLKGIKDKSLLNILYYIKQNGSDIDWERVKAYLNILADNSEMDDVMKAELHKVSSRMPSGVWAIDFNSLQLSIEAQVEIKMSMLA